MQESTKKEIVSWIKSIAIALLIAFIFRQFFFSPTTVSGQSMEPTFQDQDKVMLSKTSEIERFDLIVFHAPDADAEYIKRVIGLPGDSIEMKDDVLYINGEPYDEPYLKENKEEVSYGNLTYDFTLQELTGESTVPEGCLFVMGDNRKISRDSRIFRFISEDSIYGEVQFRFYPLQELGIPK